MMNVLLFFFLLYSLFAGEEVRGASKYAELLVSSRRAETLVLTQSTIPTNLSSRLHQVTSGSGH